MQLVKRLGLAIAVVFALGASVGATAASASFFTAQEYTSVAYSSASAEDEVQEIAFPNAAGNCRVAMFDVWSGVSEQMSAALDTDVECSQFSVYEGHPTFKSNGCEYIFHAGSETSPGNFAGTMDIGPTGCGPIRLDGAMCKRAFAAQTGIPITLHNEGSGSTAKTVMEANSTLQYTIVEGTYGWCGKGTQSASYKAKWRITTETEGEQVGNSISPFGLGVYLGGEGPKFEAEKYPMNLVANQDPVNTHVLQFEGGRKLRCGNISMSSVLSGANSGLTLTPAYWNCTFEVFGTPWPTTVAVKSCTYSTTVSGGGPPSTGTLGIACSKEGDAIEIKVYESSKQQEEGKTWCHYKIAPQSGLKGLGLSNFGSGSGRKIAVKFESVAIPYTRFSGTLANCGKASSTATYTGTTNIEGSS